MDKQPFSRKAQKIKNILKNQEFVVTQNGTPCFLAGDRTPRNSAGKGLLGKIQEQIKQNGRLYYFLIRVFAPVFTNPRCEKRIRTLLTKYQEKHIIINLGSGPAFLQGRRDIINIDIFAFPEVDVVADATDLPLEDETVDLIVNLAMLEHVDNPREVVAETYRVLKEGGETICYLPFMVPFHAAPHDYHRWTIPGVMQLFSNFEIAEVGIGAGPTSGMLWVFQEWLSLLASFGSKALHDLVLLALMFLTAPIKLLDLVLVKFPYAEKIASGYYVVGKKSAREGKIINGKWSMKNEK